MYDIEPSMYNAYCATCKYNDSYMEYGEEIFKCTKKQEPPTWEDEDYDCSRYELK